MFPKNTQLTLRRAMRRATSTNAAARDAATRNRRRTRTRGGARNATSSSRLSARGGPSGSTTSAHTTASLLMMSGADLAAVQRTMRHQDPRTTTEFYGHLASHYLKREVERLSFGAPFGTEDAASAPQVPREPQLVYLAGGAPESPPPAGPARAGARKAAPFTTRLLPTPAERSSPPSQRGTDGKDRRAVAVVGARGFEPPTFCSQKRGSKSQRFAAACNQTEVLTIPRPPCPGVRRLWEQNGGGLGELLKTDPNLGHILDAQARLSAKLGASQHVDQLVQNSRGRDQRERASARRPQDPSGRAISSQDRANKDARVQNGPRTGHSQPRDLRTRSLRTSRTASTMSRSSLSPSRPT
jgi:hypothetical protein